MKIADPVKKNRQIVYKRNRIIVLRDIPVPDYQIPVTQLQKCDNFSRISIDIGE